MINVSKTLKNAMKSSVKYLKSTIIISGEPNQIFNDSDHLISIQVQSEGRLFGAVIKIATVKLFGSNFDLINKDLEIHVNIETSPETFEEMNLGEFTIESQSTDLEKNITTLTCYDKLGVIAKQKYVIGSLNFPCTVKNLAQQVADYFGLTLADMSKVVNTDKMIHQDLYSKINNITYRDIISEISGATGSLAVIKNNTLYFLEPRSENKELLTYDNLKKFKLHPKYGPVNSLVLARTPQEDNIAIRDEESISKYGLTDIKIANNQIMDGNRESFAQSIFEKIKGLEYHPFSATTEGHGWHEPGDEIMIQSEDSLKIGDEVSGIAVQKTTTGINRAFIPESATQITRNGITFTPDFENQSLKINGKCTADDTVFRINIAGEESLSGSLLMKVARISGTIIKPQTRDAFWSISAPDDGWDSYRLSLENQDSAYRQINLKENFFYKSSRIQIDKGCIFNNYEIKFQLSENSNQNEDVTYEPYSGGFNNLFDEFKNLPITEKGVTFSRDKDFVKLEGILSGDHASSPKINLTNKLIDGSIYTLSAMKPDKNFSIEVKAVGIPPNKNLILNTRTNQYMQFTVDKSKYSSYEISMVTDRVIIWGTGSKTLFNRFGLYKGHFDENTAPLWSEFNQGLPSPNLDYSEEIITLNRGSELVATGKNLVSIHKGEKTVNGLSIKELADGSIVLNGTPTAGFGIKHLGSLNLKPGKKYTASIEVISGNTEVISPAGTSWVFLFQPRPADNFLTLSADQKGIYAETKTTSAYYKSGAPQIWLGFDEQSNKPFRKFNNFRFKLMMNEGEEILPFEPYLEKKIQLPLGDIELSKVGEFKDRIFYDGTWKLEKKTASVSLNGTENWIEVIPGVYYSSEINNYATKDNIPVCSHFVGVVNSANAATFASCKSESIGFANFTSPSRLYLKSSKSLQQIFNNRTIKLIYALKAPSVTNITDKVLLEALNSYANLKNVIITKSTLKIGNGIEEILEGESLVKNPTDYALAGGIIKTIYNTEIKVDRQNQEIRSIVEKTAELDGKIESNHSQIIQNINSISNSIQITGGANLLYNSVGYAIDSNQSPTVWEITGTVRSSTSAESLTMGAKSGNQICINRHATLIQSITVTPGEPISLSARFKKGIVGAAKVTIFTSTSDKKEILLKDQKEYLWEELKIEGFIPELTTLTIKVTNDSELVCMTDLMLNAGDKSTVWQQASGEIMNANVIIDKDGLTIKNSRYPGDYMNISPLEIANYSNASGSEKKTFWLNRDLTYAQKLQLVEQLTMPPIKIIPIAEPGREGWAFVKEKGEN